MDEPAAQSSRRPRCRARQWCCTWWLAPVIVALCLMLPKCWQGAWAVDMGRYAAIGYQSWTRILEGDLTGFYALTEATNPGSGPALPYYNKPPLPLLIHGAALHAFGRNLWATRLPAILAMAASVGLLACTARHLAGRRFGLLAGLVAATTIALTRHAAQISLDIWQLLFLSLCVALVARGVAQRPAIDAMGRTSGRTSVLLGGAVIGLALLCKPLVGLMIVPMLAAWLICIGRARLITPLLLGTLVGLVLPGAWYALAYAHWGQVFLDVHFGRQIMDRARGEMSNMNAGAGSPFYYAIDLLRDFWPWMLTTLLGFWALARGRLSGGVRRAALLALCVGVSWFVLCSMFADKRPRYVIPAVWVWSLLSAAWLDACAWPWLARLRRPFSRWAAPVAIVGAIVVSLLPITIYRPPAEKWSRVLEVIERDRLAPVYSAGLQTSDRCRYMLATGEWAYPLNDDAGRLLVEPPIGAYVLYDTRSVWRPGQSEAVVLVSAEYTLTRLTGPWAAQRVERPVAPAPPTDVPDPEVPD